MKVWGVGPKDMGGGGKMDSSFLMDMGEERKETTSHTCEVYTATRLIVLLQYCNTEMASHSWQVASQT